MYLRNSTPCFSRGLRVDKAFWVAEEFAELQQRFLPQVQAHSRSHPFLLAYEPCSSVTFYAAQVFGQIPNVS